MKVTIVYFSGTGNTKAIAEGYKLALEASGHIVSLMSIEEGQIMDEHELLIVGGPIYAGNMPDELINWVRKNVGQVTGKKAIVFSTSAGLLNANGVKSIGKKMVKKGYTLIDMSTYEMPRNFYFDKYDPTSEAVQKQEFENAGRMIIESLSNLDKRRHLVVDESVYTIDFFADLFRIMAKYMGKSFKINSNCIGCGLCEKSCPKQNIQYREKKYMNRCILCTRCIHSCPVNAISYKGKIIEQYKVHYDISVD